MTTNLTAAPTPTAPPGPPRRPRRRPVVPEVLRTDDVPAAELRAGLRNGTLVRVAPGVVGLAPPPEPRWRHSEGLQLLGVRATSRRLTTPFWFSHETAALLWGCRVWQPGAEVHVTQLSKPPHDTIPQVHRHADALAHVDRSAVDGLPVTSLVRTALDCACSMTPERALAVVDSALFAGADRASLVARADEAAGRRGIRLARRVIALADPRSDSVGESRTRWQLAAAGLPIPELAIPVETFLGTRWVDLGWPELRIGIEFDGAVKYSGGEYGDPRRRLFEEKRRHDALIEAGWIVVHVTWDDLAHPERLIGRVRAALAAGRRRRRT
ncbi:hypothetical protein [Luteimicrobium xylanilyticum]|uniref:hypothetical protein n=1 Tax=Luteimicrobium xylanilyticum TaxID=1133546 RepID=UPI0004B0741C|nr:hypothetical protein [Luteimicrobium xylanilyticum]